MHEKFMCYVWVKYITYRSTLYGIYRVSDILSDGTYTQMQKQRNYWKKIIH